LDVAPDLPARLARWKPVPMPFAGERLTVRERGLVEKLIEACRQIENIFWRQSDPEGRLLRRPPRLDMSWRRDGARFHDAVTSPTVSLVP